MRNIVCLGEHQDKVSKDDEKNVFWVNAFTEDSAKTFCQAVLKFTNQDSDTPLLVYIDSYGGHVDALASMISVLDRVPNTVITIATGKAMSCGAILLSHGDLRYAAPHSRVMIHEISGGAVGNINDIKTTVSENDRVNEYYMDLLARNCGFRSRRDLAKFFTNNRRDYYMTPRAAASFGIVDKVGFPFLRKISRYELVVGDTTTSIRG